MRQKHYLDHRLRAFHAIGMDFHSYLAAAVGVLEEAVIVVVVLSRHVEELGDVEEENALAHM